jgi:hypothetical protein
MGRKAAKLLAKADAHRERVLASIAALRDDSVNDDHASGSESTIAYVPRPIRRVTCRDVFYDGTPNGKDLVNARREQEIVERMRHRLSVPRAEYEQLPLVRAAKQVQQYVRQRLG